MTKPKSIAAEIDALAKGHVKVRVWKRAGVWWLSRRAMTASCDCRHSREIFRLGRAS